MNKGSFSYCRIKFVGNGRYTDGSMHSIGVDCNLTHVVSPHLNTNTLCGYALKPGVSDYGDFIRVPDAVTCPVCIGVIQACRGFIPGVDYVLGGGARYEDRTVPE